MKRLHFPTLLFLCMFSSLWLKQFPTLSAPFFNQLHFIKTKMKWHFRRLFCLVALPLRLNNPLCLFSSVFQSVYYNWCCTFSLYYAVSTVGPQGLILYLLAWVAQYLKCNRYSLNTYWINKWLNEWGSWTLCFYFHLQCDLLLSCCPSSSLQCQVLSLSKYCLTL